MMRGIHILIVTLGLGSGCGTDPESEVGDAASETSTGSTTDGPPSSSSASGSGSGSTGGPQMPDSSGGPQTGTSSTSDGGSSSDTGPPPASTRVLFLGNSYTQWHAMTDMVASLGEELGEPLEVTAITQGGATVADLLARLDVQDALQSQDWDFVVIQGQSYEPLVQPLVFEDAALELAGLAMGAGAVPVMFETWARAEGHPLYDEPFSGGDPAAMQALLHAAYAGVAEDSGGALAPVGQGWARCLEDWPQIDLHEADGSHPTIEGSYLTAVVMAGVMTRSEVSGAGWMPESIASDDAAALRGCAEQALLAR